MLPGLVLEAHNSLNGNGDLISVNHEGHRFTWRVQGLTEGATLRLIRVRARDVDDDIKGENDK